MTPRSFARRPRSAQRRDWGDAPDGGTFYGRAHELAQLEHWITGERCRLVAVLGIGGLGKTTLAAQGARRCADHFAVVIWRSLLNAPSLAELLADWLPLLFDHQLAHIPPGFDAQLALLFEALRERRCLLLTSREQPRVLARLEADTPLARSLMLTGLGTAVGGELLAARGVRGSEASTAALVARYSGNPLALKLVAEAIHEVFGGDVAAFLGDDTPIFDDICDVLDQQFARLTPTEHDLLRWLAIAREPLTEAQLWQLAAGTIPKQAFLEAVRSLLRRSLLERASPEDRPGAFGLQNVVAEYVAGSLITQVSHELTYASPDVLHTHALILAHAKEYVRQSQERTILRPIGERLLAAHGAPQLEARCKQLLETMRRERPRAPSFLVGNLLNLLLHLQIDLRGYDLSHRNVWGAYLRGADLPGLNLAHADLAGSVFADYAGAVTAVALSPDGQLLAAGADSGAISLWRTADRQLIGICEGHTSHVWSLAFGGEQGQLLASGSADTAVRIWDVERRQTLSTLTGHTSVVSTVAFHPEGMLVASGSLDQTVRLWDARSGRPLATLQAGAMRIESVAFSPDGALLATCGHDQLVRVWDWRRAEVLNILRGHTNLVKALGFCPSPEGSGAPPLLASGGDDQTVQLWDTQTGASLASLTGHTAVIIALAATADGRWLFSGSDDQTVRVWDLSPA